jgi:TRAP-type mannitol/chloroaromatic compound transport system permease small subunit
MSAVFRVSLFVVFVLLFLGAWKEYNIATNEFVEAVWYMSGVIALVGFSLNLKNPD